MTTSAITAIGTPRPVRVKLASTAATDVYACPLSHFARIIALRCANTSVGAINITVTIVSAAAVSYIFYPTNSLAAAGVIDFDLAGHPLQATEKVQVQASGADTIQVIGVVMETSRNST